MNQVESLKTVAQFNTKRGQETLHPLVTVLNQTNSKPLNASWQLTDIYEVFL